MQPHLHHQHAARPRRDAAAPQVIRCGDLIALIAFGDGATTLSRFVSAFDADLMRSVQQLPETPPGWTNLTAGIRRGLDLLAGTPPGLRRRMWVLSDGYANREVEGLWPQVQRAVRMRININTVGIGDAQQFNRDQLMRIAGTTHNGKYFEASTISAIGQVFKEAAGQGRINHRGEATAFVIDASGSMFSEKMGGQSRIEAVRDAMLNLLRYKQRVWS